VKLLEFGLLLKGIDQLSSPLRAMANAVEGLDRIAKNAKGLKAFSDTLDDVSRRARDAGLVMAGAGYGLGRVIGLTELPGQAIEAQHEMRAIGNAAQLTASQIAFAREKLIGIGGLTNQYQSDLIGGFKILSDADFDPATALKLLIPIGKTATAVKGDLADVARTAVAMRNNLKFGADEIPRGFEIAQSTMREMAEFFPSMAASAQRMGMKGPEGMASLVASMKVARLGAGSLGEAASNTERFLMRLTSPDIVNNFAAFGVNLQREMETAAALGEDPILSMAELIESITGGDDFKIGDLVGDRQGGKFVRAMLEHRKEYGRFRQEVLDSNGAIEKSYVEMLGTFAEQWKAMKIATGKIALPAIDVVLGKVVSILQFINAHPWMNNIAIGLSAVGIVGGGTLATLGLLGQAAAWTLGGLAKYPGILKSIVGMFETWALRGMYLVDFLRKFTIVRTIGGYLGVVATGFRVAAAGVWMFTTALLANPITWIVLAIAAVGAATYELVKNWRVIWSSLKELGPKLYEAGANLSRMIFEGIASTMGLPIGAVEMIARGIRNLLPFSPAKTGPLKDLHRVKIVETLASSIKPRPAVRAMQRVAAGMMLAASPAAGQGAAGGGESIHIAINIPAITVNASSPDIPEWKRAHADLVSDIVRQVRGELARGSRTDF
jgi:hypothetical protein